MRTWPSSVTCSGGGCMQGDQAKSMLRWLSGGHVLSAAIVLCITDFALHGTNTIGPLTVAGMALFGIGALAQSAQKRGLPEPATIGALILCALFFLGWLVSSFNT